ncbi:hypothetical protein BGM61_07750 [Listeria monocytogenes]|nr:hypothetical protein [Listeria monocytogenes]
MVKIVNVDGSTVEGSVEELLELVKGLPEDTSMSNTNDIRVLGNTYEKAVNNAEKGDYIVFEAPGVSGITPGRPYLVAYVDSFGDAIVIDNDNDEYNTDGDEFTVYRKTGPKNAMSELTSDNTSLGEFFVIVDTQGNWYDKGDLVSLNDKLLGGDSAEFKRNYDGREQILSYNQVRRASR